MSLTSLEASKHLLSIHYIHDIIVDRQLKPSALQFLHLSNRDNIACLTEV